MSERTAAAGERLRESLKAYPELRESIRQSIRKRNTPEEIDKMAGSAVRLFQAIKAIQVGTHDEK